MSYILDALNKSEQERRPKKTPDLNTVHRHAGIQVEHSKSHWLYIITAIVIVNGIGISYWIASDSEEIQSVQDQESAIQSINSVSASNPTSSTSITSRAVQAVPTTSPNSVPASETITPVNTRPQVKNVTPVRVSELPINIQRRVPNLTFSSHLFSEDAKFRMVNINGKMISEGAIVADGFKLVEITEEGVVLSYLHYTFEVSVLRDWSFN